MRGQDELHIKALAVFVQQIQRLQVVRHVAIGRRNDGGAAVKNMVAAKEQAVFFEQDAQMIGRMPRRVNKAQGVLRLRSRGGQHKGCVMRGRVRGSKQAVRCRRGE